MLPSLHTGDPVAAALPALAVVVLVNVAIVLAAGRRPQTRAALRT
jgi:hypothetical protein